MNKLVKVSNGLKTEEVNDNMIIFNSNTSETHILNKSASIIYHIVNEESDYLTAKKKYVLYWLEIDKALESSELEGDFDEMLDFMSKNHLVEVDVIS